MSTTTEISSALPALKGTIDVVVDDKYLDTTSFKVSNSEGVAVKAGFKFSLFGTVNQIKQYRNIVSETSVTISVPQYTYCYVGMTTRTDPAETWNSELALRLGNVSYFMRGACSKQNKHTDLSPIWSIISLECCRDVEKFVAGMIQGRTLNSKKGNKRAEGTHTIYLILCYFSDIFTPKSEFTVRMSICSRCFEKYYTSVCALGKPDIQSYQDGTLLATKCISTAQPGKNLLNLIDVANALKADSSLIRTFLDLLNAAQTADAEVAELASLLGSLTIAITYPEEKKPSKKNAAVADPNNSPEEKKPSKKNAAVADPSNSPEEKKPSKKNAAVADPHNSPEEKKPSKKNAAVADPNNSPEEKMFQAGFVAGK